MSHQRNQVKPFYSERIVSKLMAKNTSILTKNTAFEHKFHFDLTNGGQFTTILLAKKRLYLAKNNWI
jgi:hypothetical protein